VPKMRLQPGLRPGPCWGSLQCPPDPLAGFKGPTSKGRGGQGRVGEERVGEGKGMERGRGKGGGKGEEKGKCHTGSSFSPLRALIINNKQIQSGCKSFAITDKWTTVILFHSYVQFKNGPHGVICEQQDNYLLKTATSKDLFSRVKC